MKKQYESPEADKVLFVDEDVICTSTEVEWPSGDPANPEGPGL